MKKNSRRELYYYRISKNKRYDKRWFCNLRIRCLLCGIRWSFPKTHFRNKRQAPILLTGQYLFQSVKI